MKICVVIAAVLLAAAIFKPGEKLSSCRGFQDRSVVNGRVVCRDHVISESSEDDCYEVDGRFESHIICPGR